MADSMPPLRPGATIGVLGGGQLGRMLATAAARLGLKAHIYSPEADSPAFDVAAQRTIAAFDDETALARFADKIDVVTYEFENVPARTAAVLGALCPVRPGPAALAVSQDRLSEKEFLASLGIETASYVPVEDAGALARAVAQLGRPAILKTRRLGYDGKGQVTIREGSDLGAIFRGLGGVPSILEAIVPFVKEISVIAARSMDGAFAAYDVTENHHVNHILSTSRAPAAIDADCAAEAVAAARKIADALDYVGVLAVEIFIAEDVRLDGARTQKIKVNEIAPRVHNSGHWTLDGALCSQFEQHIRAIAGWPLGSTRRHGDAVEMRNLIGEEVNTYAEILAEDGACLHLYGKAEGRPGRKMGHVTRVFRKSGGHNGDGRT
jgi:5-(carboxyamino)imidazole ribonucleotide synthase